MEQTFHGGAIHYGNNGQTQYSDGEFILVDKMTYRFSSPLRGDVAVFTPGI
jgi:signal peptidase I